MTIEDTGGVTRCRVLWQEQTLVEILGLSLKLVEDGRGLAGQVYLAKLSDIYMTIPIRWKSKIISDIILVKMRTTLGVNSRKLNVQTVCKILLLSRRYLCKEFQSG